MSAGWLAREFNTEFERIFGRKARTVRQSEIDADEQPEIDDVRAYAPVNQGDEE